MNLTDKHKDELRSIIENFDDYDHQAASSCADFIRKRISAEKMLELFKGITGVDEDAINCSLSDEDIQIAMETVVDDTIIDIANMDRAMDIFRLKHQFDEVA